MGRGRSRARSAEDQERVRQKFLDCARSVFMSAGAHGLTMRRLAAEAGYSAGTIYLYFPSRHDLLREIWTEDMENLLATLRDGASSTAVPAQRLRQVLETYVRFWMGHPDHFRGMFMENDRTYLNERATFADDESVRSVHNFLVDVCSDAIRASGSPDRDALSILHSLLAAVHGVVALHIGAPAFPWTDGETMLATILDGLLKGLALQG